MMLPASLTGESQSPGPLQINKIPIGDGKPGQVTRRILEKWNKIAGIDVAAQAMAHLSLPASAANR